MAHCRAATHLLSGARSRPPELAPAGRPRKAKPKSMTISAMPPALRFCRPLAVRCIAPRPELLRCILAPAAVACTALPASSAGSTAASLPSAPPSCFPSGSGPSVSETPVSLADAPDRKGRSSWGEWGGTLCCAALADASDLSSDCCCCGSCWAS